MPQALRDHEPIDAIGRQIFHVTVEQICATAIQVAVAITNHRPRGGTCPLNGTLSDALDGRSQVRMRIESRFVSRDLVRFGKLPDRDRILIRVTGPGAVHPARGLVFLVFGEDAQRTFVEFGVFAARKERGHAAYGKHSMLVRDRRKQQTQILEERHVVRNRVAVR